MSGGDTRRRVFGISGTAGNDNEHLDNPTFLCFVRRVGADVGADGEDSLLICSTPRKLQLQPRGNFNFNPKETSTSTPRNLQLQPRGTFNFNFNVHARETSQQIPYKYHTLQNVQISESTVLPSVSSQNKRLPTTMCSNSNSNNAIIYIDCVDDDTLFAFWRFLGASMVELAREASYPVWRSRWAAVAARWKQCGSPVFPQREGHFEHGGDERNACRGITMNFALLPHIHHLGTEVLDLDVEELSCNVYACCLKLQCGVYPLLHAFGIAALARQLPTFMQQASVPANPPPVATSMREPAMPLDVFFVIENAYTIAAIRRWRATRATLTTSSRAEEEEEDEEEDMEGDDEVDGDGADAEAEEEAEAEDVDDVDADAGTEEQDQEEEEEEEEEEDEEEDCRFYMMNVNPDRRRRWGKREAKRAVVAIREANDPTTLLDAEGTLQLLLFESGLARRTLSDIEAHVHTYMHSARISLDSEPVDGRIAWAHEQTDRRKHRDAQDTLTVIKQLMSQRVAWERRGWWVQLCVQSALGAAEEEEEEGAVRPVRAGRAGRHRVPPKRMHL